MSKSAEPLIEKYFAGWEHPYQRLEREIDALVQHGATLVDVGCGRTAPVLQKYLGRDLRLIGLDCVEFANAIDGLELYNRDIRQTGLPSDTVDVVMARSVMEHVQDPVLAYQEIFRILRPGGHFVFLTANIWDYATLVARLVPNSLHPWVVRKTEGRAEEDVFPTVYGSNSRRQVSRLAQASGLDLVRFEYLGQYPNYLLFSRPLFLVGTAYEKLIARYSSLQWLRGWILVTLRKGEVET